MNLSPKTQFNLTLGGIASSIISIILGTVVVLQFLGLINIGKDANGQVVDPITKTEVETTYVKKEKLVDTVNLVDQKIQSLSKEIQDLSKKQDKMDDKLDKIIDKLSKP